MKLINILYNNKLFINIDENIFTEGKCYTLLAPGNDYLQLNALSTITFLQNGVENIEELDNLELPFEPRILTIIEVSSIILEYMTSSIRKHFKNENNKKDITKLFYTDKDIVTKEIKGIDVPFMMATDENTGGISELVLNGYSLYHSSTGWETLKIRKEEDIISVETDLTRESLKSRLLNTLEILKLGMEYEPLFEELNKSDPLYKISFDENDDFIIKDAEEKDIELGFVFNSEEEAGNFLIDHFTTFNEVKDELKILKKL